MDRLGCEGRCPVYNLTILADGTVTYEGFAHVAIEGTQGAMLNTNQVQLLILQIERADFFSLEDAYYAGGLDLPSVIISITMNGTNKKIFHMGPMCGDGPTDPPRALCSLEDGVDMMVNSYQWIGPQ